MIFYNYKCGLEQQQSSVSLRAAFSDDVPSKSNVSEWFAEFKFGRRSPDDETRCSLSVEASIADNIATVQAMVEEDAWVTLAQLMKAIGINPHHPT
ncbi:unnamed protein product [Echinostoma caproni]|uniref:HTH_48 domain-containing protein n=1 Tax=Echinostoma caproni TaxID=27848 RepID=A0A183AA40_9TREM|nr:unnamed protein product [Echinostoma caproni]